MTGRELMDFGARFFGLVSATGLLGIGAIFALYRLEEWLRKDDR